MNNQEFKKMFGEIAKTNAFGPAFGGWFKEGEECIVVLDLQKSNFGNYYRLMIKIYVQGMFGNTYSKCKTLVKGDVGDIFTGPPPQYADIFHLEKPINDEQRIERLSKLFTELIVPLTDKALSKAGIRELAKEERISLLPAVRKELERL